MHSRVLFRIWNLFGIHKVLVLYKKVFWGPLNKSISVDGGETDMKTSSGKPKLMDG